MKEQRPGHQEQSPSWQQDIALCDATFHFLHGEATTVRARVHTREEPYRRGEAARTIELLHTLAGTRSSLQLRPYILEPEMTLTVGFAGDAHEDQVGTVLSSSWEGMRHREVGQVQAWHYPTDRLTVLWECFYHCPFRDQPLLQDGNMTALWNRMESMVLARFPQTRQIVTPHSDPEFHANEYETFLQARGYERASSVAYRKVVDF